MSNSISYKDKKAFAFDLDGTLAPSKKSIEPYMVELLCRLLERGDKKVAVLSGELYSQFKKQFLDHIPNDEKLLKNLYLFPLNGSTCYMFKDGAWAQIYDEPLTQEEKNAVFDALKKADKEVLGTEPRKIYGEVIEDRSSQIAFSALGQEAPLPEKIVWDPDHAKRKPMVDLLNILLPGFDVMIGGTTTIDILRKGLNKAHAIRKMEEYSGVGIKDMLFIGDAIFEGGNDYEALESGVDYVKVNGPEDSANIIREVLGV